MQEISAIDEYCRRERERQIASDHELALHLVATEGMAGENALDAEGDDGVETAVIERTLRELSERIHERDEPLIAASSNAAARQSEEPRQEMAYCDTCMENFPSHAVLRLPCRHGSCQECLRELFRLSMTDESLFPPRCCRQHVPLAEARLLLGEELTREFEHQSVELSTHDRTYCHDVNCSTFIPPTSIQASVGACPSCRRATCSMCKGAQHDGDYPQDPGLQMLARTAGEEGWRRCRCSRWIELRDGCNHMT